MLLHLCWNHAILVVRFCSIILSYHNNIYSSIGFFRSARLYVKIINKLVGRRIIRNYFEYAQKVIYNALEFLKLSWEGTSHKHIWKAGNYRRVDVKLFKKRFEKKNEISLKLSDWYIFLTYKFYILILSFTSTKHILCIKLIIKSRKRIDEYWKFIYYKIAIDNFWNIYNCLPLIFI